MEFLATRSVRILRHVKLDILNNILLFKFGDVPFLFLNNSTETHVALSIMNFRKNQPAPSATTQPIRK